MKHIAGLHPQSPSSRSDKLFPTSSQVRQTLLVPGSQFENHCSWEPDLRQKLLKSQVKGLAVAGPRHAAVGLPPSSEPCSRTQQITRPPATDPCTHGSW